MDLARQNLDEDWLRRWWVRKYRRPATDPTFCNAPLLALQVEYVEDALESGALQLGTDGVPVRSYTLADGTEVMQTGDPVIDQMEQEFAARAQRDIDARLARGEKVEPPAAPAKDPEAPWYAEEDLLGR